MARSESCISPDCKNDDSAYVGTWVDGQINWFRMAKRQGPAAFTKPGYYQLFFEELAPGSGILRAWQGKWLGPNSQRDSKHTGLRKLKHHFSKRALFDPRQCQIFCTLNPLWLATGAAVEYILTELKDPIGEPEFERLAIARTRSIGRCCQSLLDQLGFDEWLVTLQGCSVDDLMGCKVPPSFQTLDFGMAPDDCEEGAVFKWASWLVGHPKLDPKIQLAALANSNRRWLKRIDPEGLLGVIETLDDGLEALGEEGEEAFL